MNVINDIELESALMASRAKFIVQAFDHHGRAIAEYGPLLGVHTMRQLADQVSAKYPDWNLAMRRLSSSAQHQQGGLK